jgi:ubiquinol-cytochrome c reductase iron-sulfur subunit
MSDDQPDPQRRKFLTAATTGVGLVGTALAATPFIRSMTPSERAKAAGAPVEIDISKLESGQLMTEEWRGKPVWIMRRTPQQLEMLKQVESHLADPKSEVKEQQPAYAQNATRSISPEVLVVVGICTHLGCSPDKRLTAGAASGLGEDWPGGFFCPCHGSKFDLAGRVYKNVPAPTNLVVPPHSFSADGKTVIVGIDPTDKKGAA